MRRGHDDKREIEWRNGYFWCPICREPYLFKPLAEECVVLHENGDDVYDRGQAQALGLTQWFNWVGVN